MTRTTTRRPGRRTTRTGAALAAPVLLACLLGATPAVAADTPFTAGPDIALGDVDGAKQPLPQAVAIGDFDSDGHQDLAIGDLGLDVVHVRLGNGDGTYSSAASISGLLDPRGVAVADFDGDGVEDLAVAARRVNTSHSVAVLRGVGDGRFVPRSSFPISGFDRATSIAVGDFDGDATADLAATSASHMTARRGQGDGTFAGGGDMPTGGSEPKSVVAADFDGDGREDLAAAFVGKQHSVGVLRGRGDVTFEAPQDSPLPNDVAGLAAGDFDEDGHRDVVVPIVFENRVSVRLGTGDGRLPGQPGDVAVGEKPCAVVVADFDGDGHEDFATANFAGGVTVRLGDGDGTFRDGGEAAAGRNAYALAVGDLDGDGAADVAAAHAFNGVVGPLLGTAAAPLAENLLVNGGFEQGLGARLPGQQPAIPGWQRTAGMTFARYGAWPHRAFPSWIEAAHWTGGTNLLWGGVTGQAGASTAEQTVDVTASAGPIDGGRAEAELSAELGGGLSAKDHMTATATFLGADGSELGSLAAGPVTAEQRRNQSTLLRRTAGAPVPAGTRRIRVTLRATAPAADTSSALADNVGLALDVRPDTGGGGPQPGGEQPGGGGGADRTSPVLGAVRLSRSRFAVAGAATAVVAAKGGTTIRYSLSEPASVALRIERKAGGRRGIRVVGTLRRTGRAGANRVAFSGRIGRRALPRGSYRLTVRATDAAGNPSTSRTKRFRILP